MQESKQDVKLELVVILFRQKSIIYWATSIIFICSVLVAFFWPPTYSATGSILVKSKKAEKSADSLEKEQLRPISITREDLASEIQILTSFNVIVKTIDYLKKQKKYLPMTKTGNLEKEVYLIKENLKTEVATTSNVITITFFDKSKDYAMTFLEVLMNQFIEYRMSVYHPASEENFYVQQVEEFKNRLSEQEDQYMANMKKTKSADPAREIDNNIELKAELENQLQELRSVAVEKSNRVEFIEKNIAAKNANALKFFDTIVTLRQLGTSLNDLEIDRVNLLMKYQPESEKVVRITEQIKDLQARLLKEARDYATVLNLDLTTIKKKIDNIERRLNILNALNVEMKQQMIQNDRLNREKAVLSASYETLAMRRNEATMANTIATSFFLSIIAKPFPSNGPVFPKKKILLPFGLVTGFLTGFAFAFIRDYFDNTYKTPKDVETFAHLPLLFSIPFSESLLKGRR